MPLEYYQKYHRICFYCYA